MVMERFVPGRENNNNQNIWPQPIDILPPRLRDVPKKYNKSRKDNIQVPMEHKTGIDRFQDCCKTGCYGFYGYCYCSLLWLL
jgi:hypothetical protein